MFTGLCENCFHPHETALQLHLLFGTNIIFFSALNRNKFKNIFAFLCERYLSFHGGSQGRLIQYLFLFFSTGLDTGLSGKGLVPD